MHGASHHNIAAIVVLRTTLMLQILHNIRAYGPVLLHSYWGCAPIILQYTGCFAPRMLLYAGLTGLHNLMLQGPTGQFFLQVFCLRALRPCKYLLYKGALPP